TRPARRSTPAPLFDPLTGTHEAVMGQETEGHMMMPPQPAPDFVMIQAQPPFTLLERRFNGPAHTGHPYQRRDGRVCGRVAEIDLEFWILSQPTPKDQPHVRAWQARAYRHAALEGELGHQGPFAAFFDQVGMPCVQRDSRSELSDPLRRRCPGDQPGLARPSAPALPTRHSRGWACQPDLRVVRYFGKIPALQRGDRIQKRAIPPKGLIARQPTKPWAALCHAGL